jgi:hypothetical protein
VAIPTISAPVRRSAAWAPIVRLSRMLRNTLQSYPNAKLWTRKDGFGVSLGGGAYLVVSCSGIYSSAAKADLLALLAAWLRADENALGPSIRRDGQYATDGEPAF